MCEKSRRITVYKLRIKAVSHHVIPIKP